MKCVNVLNKKSGAGVVAAAMMAAMLSGSSISVFAASGIDMSTEYPGVMVKAGDTISFSLDFESLDGESHDVSLSVASIPEEWTGYFKGGSNEVTRVHLSGAADEETGTAVTNDLATFSLTVPAETAEGVYTVELEADAGAGDTDTLELEVSVNEEETGQSSFTSEYPEQQGSTGTVFSFDTTIVNNRATAQSYALSAQVPDGWQITFTPSGESTNVASLEVEAGSSQGMTVTVTPPATVEKGDYAIPISAISASDSLSTELSVSITGTYKVSLSTSDGRLSCDAYPNKGTNVTLTVTNDGNVDLTNLNLTSSAATGWDVSFSESSIETLEAGATKEITATITPNENVITGDYVTSISISNDETSSGADFRVTVKTSTTWGIVAIAIIVVLVLGLAAIFKKYGRR